MRLSEFGQKRHSTRKVIVWLKDMYQNYGTLPVLVGLQLESNKRGITSAFLRRILKI
ncbi:hypothetical protein Gotur_034547 [Gossypium turneri]